MRWKTAWLTTMLVVTTSAVDLKVIEHNALEIIEVSSDNRSDPLVKNPLDLEAIVITSSTTEPTRSTTITVASSTSPTTISENREDAIRVNSQDEITLTVDSEDHGRMDGSDEIDTSDESNNSENNYVVLTPDPDCVEDDDECVDHGDGHGDNEEADEPGDKPESPDVGGDNEGPDTEDGVVEDNEEGEDDDNTNPEVEGDDENDDLVANENLIVETKFGRVQGFPWQGNDHIISYIDIPYGAISHPFQAATVTNSWDAVHVVKDHEKRCPQLQDNTYVGDTDCLTLSIFKPLEIKDASVLFHIHAENFDTGSGDPFIYGPEYLVNNGIILILPNYRLGALGFLCMQNETAPGNMALKDLSLALNWISENIEAFGGDPKKISVSGDGKSGALAGLLALSPMSKDYVSKVIAESGSFLAYWALDRYPLSTAEDLFERLTAVENSQSRVDISLQDLDTSAIVTAAKGIHFRPCLETDNGTAFIVQSPYEIITNEKFEKTSFLLGSAMYAGTHEALFQTAESIQRLNEDVTLFLPEDLKFSTMTLKTEAGERVKTQYFGSEPISVGDVKNLSLWFTDMGYLGPGIRSARLLVKAGATVYFYEFAFVGEMNRVLESVNHPVEGAVKGDIVGYLFTQDGVVPGEQQEDERKMIDTLTQMWTSFLNTGIPSTDAIEWNNLENKDPLEEQWLLIDSEPQMRKGVHVNRLPLWTEIYDKHYIDSNHASHLSSCVYSILLLQMIFWVVFCRNVSHIY